jgi:hypothetical protein
MPDYLVGVREKLKRAKKHVEDLSANVGAFGKTDSYRVVSDEDPNSGDLVFHLRIKTDIPAEEWAAIIGDAVQNTRSALDHLACALVSRESGESALTRRTCFPISREAQELKAATSPEVKGMRQDAADAIRALDPYKEGNDTLWAIKALNDRDKHRLLLVVATETVGVTINMGRKFGLHIPFTIRPAALPDEFPVKDGDVVFTIKKAARGSDDDEHPDFTFDISFHEPEIIERQPVIPTLINYIGYVEDVVLPKFTGFF